MNNGNGFAGELVKKYFIFSPNTAPHVDVLNATKFSRLNNHNYRLELLFAASYNDHRSKIRPEFQHAQHLNASQLFIICPVLLRNAIFDHNIVLLEVLLRLSVLLVRIKLRKNVAHCSYVIST